VGVDPAAVDGRLERVGHGLAALAPDPVLVSLPGGRSARLGGRGVWLFVASALLPGGPDMLLGQLGDGTLGAVGVGLRLSPGGAMPLRARRGVL